MTSLTNEKNWIGNTEEFAALCEKWLKIKNIGKNDPQVTVRLVRDYVSRGILSKPIPKGKEVMFNYEQLIQFVACRHLLEEGFSLKRIAEDIQTSDLDIILSWIPNEDADKAMSLIESFKSKKQEKLIERQMARRGPTASRQKRRNPAADLAMSSPQPPREEAISKYREGYSERTRRRASYQIDTKSEYFDQYFDAVKDFDKNFNQVIKQDLTAIQLKSWLILFIDRLKLQRLTIEEAEEIGEAIKAALVNQARLPDRDSFMNKDK